ncbi:MAG: hypothetical protein WBF99_19630 [Xanthobacteraceae bacterium]
MRVATVFAATALVEVFVEGFVEVLATVFTTLAAVVFLATVFFTVVFFTARFLTPARAVSAGDFTGFVVRFTTM